MISKNRTRLTLSTVLHSLNKDKVVIDYPMTDFRHAIFKVVERCGLINDCEWSFDTGDKLTICTLLFRTKKVVCSYDFSTGKIDVDEYQKTDECGEVLVSGRECTCEELPSVVYALQPKCRIVKRKN